MELMGVQGTRRVSEDPRTSLRGRGALSLNGTLGGVSGVSCGPRKFQWVSLMFQGVSRALQVFFRRVSGSALDLPESL